VSSTCAGGQWTRLVRRPSGKPAELFTMVEKGAIEIAPLAYMRGRTLNDAFIILDEAQNTTSEQMKMFLTRLGFGSKAVITGDVTQIDLPAGRTSGLVEAMKHFRAVAPGKRPIVAPDDEQDDRYLPQAEDH
jgi:predicted ribonuclease YlaK